MLLQILLILFLCLVCATWISESKKVENFWFMPNGSKICDDLNGLGRHECLRCANAGYCTNPLGENSCVEANINMKPLNGQDCISFQYGNDLTHISLIDPQEPYWVEPNRYWNPNEHINLQLPEGQEYPPDSSREVSRIFRHRSHYHLV